MNRTPILRVRLWGVRGSVAVPGPGTVAFGGNTSCVEVGLKDGATLVFDAGTGIRELRADRRRSEGVVRLFLTHYHMDHISALPFFSLLYQKGREIRVYGPSVGDAGPLEVLGEILRPPFFPVSLAAFPAQLCERVAGEGVIWEGEGLRVRAVRVRHPGITLGYRIEAGVRSVVYVPDNELLTGEYPRECATVGELAAFAEDTDLLIHDATYREQEMRQREGWGHSTPEQALGLAERAGAKRLVLFHHDPSREDRSLAEEQAGWEERSGGRVELAREGREFSWKVTDGEYS